MDGEFSVHFIYPTLFFLYITTMWGSSRDKKLPLAWLCSVGACALGWEQEVLQVSKDMFLDAIDHDGIGPIADIFLNG